MDMSQFVIPKSDQLNADDLSVPRTVRITKVVGTGNADQPVSVHFEGDDGRPYKPCKSMRRVMISAWGVDATQYVGRSMTLYRDPKVVFGGMAVGGIRISHMSHIDKPINLALTVTKAKRAPYRVQPLTGVAQDAPSRPPAVDPATGDGHSTKGDDPSIPEPTGSGGGAHSSGFDPWLAGSPDKTARMPWPLSRPITGETRHFSPAQWCDALDLLLTDPDDDPYEVWIANQTTHVELMRAAKTEAGKIALKRVSDAAGKAIRAVDMMKGPGA